MAITMAIPIALLCLLLAPAEAAKILVIPIPVSSMLRLGVQTGQAIMEAGHEVWIMAGTRNKEDLTKKGFHVLEYDIEYIHAFEKKAGQNMAAVVANPGKSKPGIMKVVGPATELNSVVCNSTLNNRALINAIREQKFDLAVMGTTLVLSCLYLIPYKLDIPYVTYAPVDEPWIAGVTALPSHQPLLYANPPFSDKMTFTERVRNTVMNILFPFIVQYYMISGDYSWFVPEKPQKSLYELRSLSKISFSIVDNTCIDYPRMSAPNHIIVGALTQAKASPLTRGTEKLCGWGERWVDCDHIRNYKGWWGSLENFITEVEGDCTQHAPESAASSIHWWRPW